MILSLDSISAVVDGTVEFDTSSGIATFSSLRILTWGTFILTGTATDMIDAVSDSFSVINYVYSMELTSNNTSPSLNFAILLTVTMKGEDNALFTGTCTVTLTESTTSLFGPELAKDITGGTGTFEVYLNSLGTKTIVATCPNTGEGVDDKTANAIIEVQANTLKISSLAPTVIAK